MPETQVYSIQATIALFGALAGGDAALALRVLAEGANPNATQGEMHNSPLMLCALYHMPVVAKALLERGANPDYARRGGDTALILTAFSNDRETAKLIVD